MFGDDHSAYSFSIFECVHSNVHSSCSEMMLVCSPRIANDSSVQQQVGTVHSISMSGQRTLNRAANVRHEKKIILKRFGQLFWGAYTRVCSIHCVRK